MASFSYIPSFQAAELSKPRVRRFQAGDGYEHRLTFGLHSDPKQWNLTFANRDDTERDGIIAFLEARGGVESFNWATPRGDTRKYVCEEWEVTLSNCNNNQIQATFREVFEP